MISAFALNIVHALNNVRSNVWAVALVIVGVVLVLYGHDVMGNSLITGSFAIFRSSSTETEPVPPNALVPVGLARANTSIPLGVPPSNPHNQ